jgi:hypothetical protein
MTNKIQFNVDDVFYSLFSHEHVPAATAAIFRVILLLKEYKCTYVVSSVAVTPQALGHEN